VIDHGSQTILCVAVSAGQTHDFALFKNSRLAVAPDLELLADTGYQGVDKLHTNSHTPHKKSKHHPLTPQQKQHNKALASRRIKVEHALRFLKRFRILSSTYRNRRKRFGLRFNLIAAVANLHK
jgi:IS5 family transposase